MKRPVFKHRIAELIFAMGGYALSALMAASNVMTMSCAGGLVIGRTAMQMEVWRRLRGSAQARA